jgi:hypothetical protein
MYLQRGIALGMKTVRVTVAGLGPGRMVSYNYQNILFILCKFKFVYLSVGLKNKQTQGNT